uniref:Heterogeneous nuclear ribonucleoprotein U-like protein 1 n=1 Tax=Euglena gracilis TaxID=3039 RepID=A0AA51UD22_EUGGR|nr:heterogeneous nuclear ribonucleoprotein U-like protein 1 [Euglena gracilis]BDX17175.1 E1B-55 kDa-associated protein 5B [Euglena gracilis]
MRRPPWHLTLPMRRGVRPKEPPKPPARLPRPPPGAKGVHKLGKPRRRPPPKTTTRLFGRGRQFRLCICSSDRYLGWMDKVRASRGKASPVGPGAPAEEFVFRPTSQAANSKTFHRGGSAVIAMKPQTTPPAPKAAAAPAASATAALAAALQVHTAPSAPPPSHLKALAEFSAAADSDTPSEAPETPLPTVEDFNAGPLSGLFALTALTTLAAAPTLTCIPLVEASSMDKLRAAAPANNPAPAPLLLPPPLPAPRPTEPWLPPPPRPPTPASPVPTGPSPRDFSYGRAAALPPVPDRPMTEEEALQDVGFWQVRKVQASPLGVVALNPADKHLDFVVRDPPDGGSSLASNVWAGCRATHGTQTGRVAYAVQVTQGVLARVGWGTASATLNLGNDDQSWGFGSTGKKSHNGNFLDYGRPWGGGDLIHCLLDCTTGYISFMHNGRELGVSHQIPAWLRAVPIFPHVLTKNAELIVMFSGNPTLPALPEGYTYIEDHNALCLSPWGATNPEYGVTSSTVPTGEREVPFTGALTLTGWAADQRRLIMLVGLPCSGKTFWAKKFIQQHPDLRFQLLSTNLIMERLMPNTVHSYADRFKKVIRAASIHLDAQMQLVSMQQGNVIWDQTNIEMEGRLKKLELFKQFKKTAVVFLPPLNLLRQWRKKQWEQTGQRVPDRVVALMENCFTLPTLEEEAAFDEVVYAFGNSVVERREVMQTYKDEAAAFSRGEKRGMSEVPENAPMEKSLRKDSYIKSYGELEFFASNPYRPMLPYTAEAQALPEDERQLLLLRQAKMDAVPTFTPAPLVAPAAPAAPQAAEHPFAGPLYEFATSSVGPATEGIRQVS